MQSRARCSDSQASGTAELDAHESAQGRANLSPIASPGYSGVRALSRSSPPPDNDELGKVLRDLEQISRLVAVAVIIVACVTLSLLLSKGAAQRPEVRAAYEREIQSE